MKINTQSPASVNTTSLLGELFLFEGHALRVYGTSEEPLFVAADVCAVLGIEHHRNAIQRVPEWAQGRGVRVNAPGGSGNGGSQEMATLTEAGLYYIGLRSNKPVAEAFQKWVCAEVLPVLRKHGFYSREGMDARLARIERAKSLRARKQALLTEARALSTEISRLEDLGADAATPGAVLAEAGLEHSGAALIRAVRNCIGYAHRNQVPVGRDRTGHMTLPTAAIRTALGLDQSHLNLS